jgi:hypothetical protein
LLDTGAVSPEHLMAVGTGPDASALPDQLDALDVPRHNLITEDELSAAARRLIVRLSTQRAAV